jgi:hypothetical protein
MNLPTTRAQRPPAIQERMLSHRNWLGKSPMTLVLHNIF